MYIFPQSGKSSPEQSFSKGVSLLTVLDQEYKDQVTWLKDTVEEAESGRFCCFPVEMVTYLDRWQADIDICARLSVSAPL